MGFGVQFAPLSTRIAAGQTASQVASGGTINVFGVLIEASANSQVTLLTADGTTTLATPRVLANDSVLIDIPWYAAQGLAVTTPANCTVTVYHSQPGA